MARRTKSANDIRAQQARIRRLAAELNGTSYRAMSSRGRRDGEPSVYAQRSRRADEIADRYVENIINARGGKTAFGKLMSDYNNLLNNGRIKAAGDLASSATADRAWERQYSQKTYMGKAVGGAG